MSSEKTVKEILTQPKYLLDSATVGEAIEFMREHKIGSTLVVNDQVELTGIFTERDVLMKIAGLNVLSETITKFMTKGPYTIKESSPVQEAVDLMKKYKFRHVPVVNDLNRPVGMISIKDLLYL